MLGKPLPQTPFPTPMIFHDSSALPLKALRTQVTVWKAPAVTLLVAIGYQKPVPVVCRSAALP